MKHRQHLLEGASLLVIVIYVKPAVIYINIILDPLPIKCKTKDLTEETLTKVSYYTRYSQKA
jgi:hypothetical protein